MDRMLLTVCLFSPAQTQDITLIVPDQPIRAAVGENAVLLCHLEPPTDLEQDMVEWSFNDQTVWVYRNKKENTMDQAKQFSKRVTFSGNKKSGNISVTLQSVNKTDEGNYTCHVERGGKSFRANITLLVEEKCEADWTIGVQQNPTMKPIVPDQPIRAAVGENAVLLCHLEPPTDLEQDLVEWIFKDEPVWVCRHHKELTSEHREQFRKRVTFSGNMTSGNISVTLQSVNKTDEGDYTCHVERGGKSFRDNITLLVEEKREDDWTIGVQQNPNMKLIVPDQPIRAAVGENAVLLCHLEPPTDLEQDMVEWSFNDQTVWVYRNQKENPRDQAKEFSNRVTFSGNMNSGNISVTLQSVTKTYEGDYTCHVIHGGKSFRAIITLLVEEKSEKKEQNNKNITPL
ncbi:junctional adhesion molecule-like isoform X1 [Genypterus blacodes]|uniref:junctional adhesion molecule-like isoform X1 n=1 Tax=Genypterus blacodes TaxID=154954 RepID=UPI003F771AAF